MHNYYYDADGVYVRTAPANPGTQPPINALRIAPPEQDGFRAVLNATRDGWELVPITAAPSILADDTRYCLAATGKYHAVGCSSIRPDGEWLTLADIHLLKPKASPCGRCKPPRVGGPA